MAKFRIPKIPPTTSKSIRFPNDIIKQVEEAIRGKDCTFTAFVVEAVRVALENLEEDEEGTAKKTPGIRQDCRKSAGPAGNPAGLPEKRPLRRKSVIPAGFPAEAGKRNRRAGLLFLIIYTLLNISGPGALTGGAAGNFYRAAETQRAWQTEGMDSPWKLEVGESRAPVGAKRIFFRCLASICPRRYPHSTLAEQPHPLAPACMSCF